MSRWRSYAQDVIAWALLFLLVGALSVPLVHEAGHALAALLAGGRRVRLERRGLLGLSTSADLPERAVVVRLFYGAGPGANLLAFAGALLCIRLFVSDGALLVACLGVALLHLTFALVNLLPLPGHDGRALFLGARDSRGSDSALKEQGEAS